MKQLKPLLILFFILLFAVLTVVYLIPSLGKNNGASKEDRKGGKEMLIKNYGSAIDSAAQVFKLPASYLKALCMLECSGMKVFDQRFEPHVYRKLQAVKSGEILNYEHVSQTMLADANDEALKNLASSWGPFQLMGYKCLLLGIKVRDIRGDQSVYFGSKWIDMTYGDVLREKRFKDAFHIHNTGGPMPSDGISRTHNRNYINNGLNYMEYFKNK